MMFKIKQIVFTILLFLAPLVGVFAKDDNVKKGTISGRITFADDTPVVDAFVAITSIQQQTITDENGDYTLDNIPYGSYKLVVSAFDSNPKQVAVKCSRANHKLSIELVKRRVVDIEEVVVVGKSQPTVVKEKGFALSVVDTKKAMLGSLPASDLLDRSSGIKLRQNGGLGSDIQYNINGLSGNSVRIFIDGISIRNYGSSFSLSSIPSSMIERIEVYKGVIPTYLAEDALGGAVNIVLKQGAMNRLTTSYSIGSFNTHKWDLNGSYRNDKTGFTAGGSAFYNYTDNSYKVWGDPIYVTDPETNRNTNITAKRFHDSYESKGVNANVGFTRTKWADRFVLGVLYSEMEKDIQHGATMAVVYGKRKSAQNTKMVNLRYEKIDLLENLDVTAFGSYSTGVRTLVDTTTLMYNWLGNVIYRADGTPVEWNKDGGEAGRATLASNLEDNVAARANVVYEFLPKHKISGSVLFNKFTRNTDDPLRPALEQALNNERSLGKIISGLSYENSLFNDKLKMSLFYKHYVQSVSLTDPTYVDGVLQPLFYDNTTTGDGYGGAASYRLVPSVLLMFSGEKALRMPDNSEVLGNTTSNVEVSYELKPEQSANVNLGAIINILDTGLHTLSTDINFFYRDITDMIQKSLPIGVTEEMYHYENIGKIASKGFDLDINYNYNQKIFVDFSFSNFNARYNLEFDSNGDRYQDYGERLRNAPYLTFNNSISYVQNDLFKRGSLLTLNYNIGYVHEFYRNSASLGGAGKAVIPSQLVQDIGITYTFPTKKISLGFDIKNLTDEQVFDNWALQKPGRAMFFKLTYNIIN